MLDKLIVNCNVAHYAERVGKRRKVNALAR